VLPIFHLPTKALMNFVTAHGIFCAYSLLTLAHRALLNRARLPTFGSAAPDVTPNASGFHNVSDLENMDDEFDIDTYSHECLRSGR
jgi:hypothetical protein